MKYKLYYGSSSSYEEQNIFISKIMECSKMEEIESVVTRESKSAFEASKRADKLLDEKDLIISCVNLSDKKIVLSGANTLGVIDPTLFTNMNVRHNLFENALQFLADVCCPVKYFENLNKQEQIKPKIDEFSQEYIELLKIYEGLMTGKIAIDSKHWNDYIKIINFIHDGLSRNSFDKNSVKCRILCSKYNGGKVF